MIEAAEAHFYLDLPRINGSSRESCEAEIAKIGERARLGHAIPWDEARLVDLDESLRGPEIPEAGQYLLGWFYQLHAERQSNGFAPAALTSEQMNAWERRRRIRMSPWEDEVVRRLDRRWLQLWAEVKTETDRERDALAKRKANQLT